MLLYEHLRFPSASAKPLKSLNPLNPLNPLNKREENPQFEGFYL